MVPDMNGQNDSADGYAGRPAGSRDTDPTGRAPAGTSLSGRGFWVAFSIAWLTIGILFGTGGIIDNQGLGRSLLLAVTNTLPLVIPSLPLAVRRRALLRPEWSLARLGLLHLAVGLTFAVTSAVLGSLLFWIVGPSIRQTYASSNAAPALIFVARTLQGVFVYALIVGFLTWTESIVRLYQGEAAYSREAELRAQAELKALRAQFNPHFVFNTLHSLLLLVRAEPATAERAIEDVAELIRYASIIQRGEVDRVSFAKELAVSERYVQLEKLRLEERLDVRWDIDEPTREAVIPAFALQTLLENAIRHGIAPREAGGIVRIRSRREGASFVLDIDDDGPGADLAAVERASGHGIDLLRRRLRALYGDDATMDVETTPGNGFRVRLRLPFIVA
jgi:sensor histidine kinase YesM